MTFPPRTYTTQDEAVLREIVEPIEATGVVEDAYAEFDVAAIADEVLTYDPAEGHMQHAGFRSTVDPDEFWDVVERHAKDER